MDMDWEPEPDPDPEPEPEPEPAPAPPTLRPPSARLAARHPPPAAPTGPPMPLDSEDPVMLQQLQVFCLSFANWKPPAGQVEQRLLRPAWSQQRDQPVRGMMWCPVVAPRRPPQAPRSSQAATPAAASEAGPSTPLPAKRSKRTKAEPEAAEPNKAQGKAAKAKPAPQSGRWLDRDCNAALNVQRIGESKWRPLELCFWPEQGRLPAKGKEYPGLGYKWLRDKPPQAQEQQPAVAQ
ncbi:hypothetical protein QJQ45_010904 [Haematococcus lacustris]|nr:hypothetical protein QJQ45_010904 [Haematococcus lacustris]